MVTGSVFDTLAIARALTAADFTPAQADALTDAVRQAAEHVDAAGVETLATKGDLTVLKGVMKAEITALEARIYRAMLVQAGAIVGALVGIAGIVAGALRLPG